MKYDFDYDDIIMGGSEADIVVDFADFLDANFADFDFATGR